MDMNAAYREVGSYMGCLKGGTVANVVVPTADYVRFATHYRFRPDFSEGADPESKGLVENLVGYVKSDPHGPPGAVGRRSRGGQRRWRNVVRRGQRRGPLRDLRRPRRASRDGGGTVRRPASLRARIGKLVVCTVPPRRLLAVY